MNMNVADLDGVLALDTIPCDHDDVIIVAAGPLTKQPGTNALRIVLVIWGDKFVVWDQFFPKYTAGYPYTGDSNFSHGDYFPLTDLGAATKRFAERLSRESECLNSIYRSVA
jgi:hypothetical protein